MTNEEHKYDLEERTAAFGERSVDFAKTVPLSAVTKPLVSQLVRASTSVGANYCEADDSSTKKEFRHKIGICKREARESKHWFRMIARAEPALKEPARNLWMGSERASSHLRGDSQKVGALGSRISTFFRHWEFVIRHLDS